MAHPSLQNQTFATPELLELILLYLPTRLLQLHDQEDPRSTKTHVNARLLSQLLHCTEVSRSWHACIHGSVLLKRHLFLAAVDLSKRPKGTLARSWILAPDDSEPKRGGGYRIPTLTAPTLNPIVQTTFPNYHFRFWHLAPSLSSSSTASKKHSAYLIITRRDFSRIKSRLQTPGAGSTVSSMLFSQPPCTAMQAQVWDQRDEGQELQDAVIQCESGLTVGTVHGRVGEWFEKNGDVGAIKLTTL